MKTARVSKSVEQHLVEFRKDLRRLEQKIGELAARVDAVEAGARLGQGRQEPSLKGALDEDTVSLWSWVGESRLLPRVAMVCFVLVVALVLRTLTDSGAIGLELGVLSGIAYSTALIACGWPLLARQRRGKKVLPACGAVLMCAVVLEAHGSFQLLSAASASWILFATTTVVAILGASYRAGSIVAFAVLPTSLSALSLGFPNVPFPCTAAVLLVANAAAMLGVRQRSMEWLPFSTLALALFFWLLWGFKAGAVLQRGDPVPPELLVDWFLPLLVAFAALFAAVAARRVLASPRAPGAFSLVVPTVNVLWAYPAALAVVVPMAGRATVLGLAGVAVAATHFGVAAKLWRSHRECVSGITAFALAGTVLLSFAVFSVTGKLVLALPACAVVALGLGVFSGACGSVSLRAVSYALQGLTCALAAGGLAYAPPAATPALAVVSAAALAALATTHYLWNRNHPPPADSWLVRIDPAHRAPIGLLWIAAVNAFLLLRLLSYAGLDALGMEIDNAFRGTQSVIINTASIALMVWGLKARDKHLLATAVLVAVVGGLKVLGSDLQNTDGVPLVLAVFSFGMAAAIGSVVLGKWQSLTARHSG